MCTTKHLDNQTQLMTTEDFQIFLNLISRKGFYEILKYVNEEEQRSYSKIQEYYTRLEITSNNTSIDVILNGLTNMGLLEKYAEDNKYLETTHMLSKTGKQVLSKLVSLQRLF